MKKKIVFTDLHYKKGDEGIFERIKKILKRDDFKEIIFLGDTFDFFFEFKGKFYKKENIKILNFLKEISKNYDVYLVRGNHDFFIGERVKNFVGCKDVVDSLCFEDTQGKILLTHGHLFKKDSLLKKILYYILQNKLDKFLFSLLPEKVGYKIAILVSKLCDVRRESRKERIKKIEKIIRENFEQKYKKIIVGHYHLNFVSTDQRIYILENFKKNGTCMVLDDKGVYFEHL